MLGGGGRWRQLTAGSHRARCSDWKILVVWAVHSFLRWSASSQCWPWLAPSAPAPFALCSPFTTRIATICEPCPCKQPHPSCAHCPSGFLSSESPCLGPLPSPDSPAGTTSECSPLPQPPPPTRGRVPAAPGWAQRPCLVSHCSAMCGSCPPCALPADRGTAPGCTCTGPAQPRRQSRARQEAGPQQGMWVCEEG